MPCMSCAGCGSPLRLHAAAVKVSGRSEMQGSSHCSRLMLLPSGMTMEALPREGAIVLPPQCKEANSAGKVSGSTRTLQGMKALMAEVKVEEKLHSAFIANACLETLH